MEPKEEDPSAASVPLRRAPPFECGPSLLTGPWGLPDAKPVVYSRGVAMLLLLCFVALDSGKEVWVSPERLAQSKQAQETPTFYYGLGQGFAAVLSFLVLIPTRAGRDALYAVLSSHTMMLVFMSLMSCASTYILKDNRDHVSGSVWLMISGVVPLLVVFTAPCFEREMSGAVRTYGWWPCLQRQPTEPWFGVLLGVSVVTIGTTMAPLHSNQLTTARGVVFCFLNVILIALRLSFTTVVYSSGSPRSVAAVFAVQFWVGLLSAPLAMLTLLHEEGDRVRDYTRDFPSEALGIYFGMANLYGWGSLAAHAAIHASSSLSIALAAAVSASVTGVTLNFAFGGQGDALSHGVSISGVTLACIGVVLHAAYMLERDRWRARGHSSEADFERGVRAGNEGSAGRPAPKPGPLSITATECSSLMDPVFAAEGKPGREWPTSLGDCYPS